MKKDNWMSIRLETPLRERVENMAKAERRTIADQAAYLMEKGLSVLEREQENTRKAMKSPAAPEKCRESA